MDLSSYFSENDLKKIEEAVAEVEAKTSGEIKVCIEKQCGPLFNNSTRVQAEFLFAENGLQYTRDKTGVLILLVLEEKKFEILADSGINAKIDPSVYGAITDTMAKAFQEGKFLAGVVGGVNRLGELLIQYFPPRPDDINELSNTVRIGG